jgi:hypothetical protein
MKRDIFFDEFTPLSIKEEEIKSPQILSFIFLFEVLLVAFGCIVFPRLEETCNEAPINLWLTVLVIIVNLHLICAAIENFIQKYQIYTSCQAAHYIFSGLIMCWMACGHYIVFYQGSGCFGSQTFLVSSIILSFLDCASVFLVGIFTWHSVGKTW